MNSRTVLLCFCLLPSAVCLSALAQGTAVTHQGRLTESGTPHTGNAEFRATLWDADNGGAVLASSSPMTVAVGVTNGLLVLPLDFDANFPRAHRWLQLNVRTTLGDITALSPRQRLTPTPYAITAGNLSGMIAVSQWPANFVTNNASGLNLSGSFSGNGIFVSSSHCHAKENFRPGEPGTVLEKVCALLITEWNFKTAPATRRLGPVAQDFKALFGLGEDDQHIATVDADGVALAAIQGLNQKLEARSQKLAAENAKLREELKSIQTRLERLTAS